MKLKTETIMAVENPVTRLSYDPRRERLASHYSLDI
jgi:hypothetical protein